MHYAVLLPPLSRLAPATARRAPAKVALTTLPAAIRAASVNVLSSRTAMD